VTTWHYDYESPQQTVTKICATGLTEVSNFNANGTVSDFTDRMGRTTTYACTYGVNLNLAAGTPSGLTAEKGREFLERAVERVAAIAEAMIDGGWRSGTPACHP